VHVYDGGFLDFEIYNNFKVSTLGVCGANRCTKTAFRKSIENRCPKRVCGEGGGGVLCPEKKHRPLRSTQGGSSTPSVPSGTVADIQLD